MVVCATVVPVKNTMKHQVHKQEASLYLINLFICISFILVSGSVSSIAFLLKIRSIIRQKCGFI